MSFLSLFCQHSAKLIAQVATKDFVSGLVDMFKSLDSIDNVSILAYPNKNLPRVEYNDPPSGERKSTLDIFLNGAFLLDPFYLAASKQGKQGFFHISELAPQGFRDSEYNRIYYKVAGFTDECGYLIKLGQDTNAFINISIGRIKCTDTFSDAELANFAAITPVITTLASQHWKAEAESGNHLDLRSQLETALECFGSSMLTDRERQIVKMILHGYSNRAISERLHISVETVKLHRKNAYAKLDIGTQGELFHLFLVSLMNVNDYENGDPLTYYHNKTNK